MGMLMIKVNGAWVPLTSETVPQFVLKTGDTMTGELLLPGDPTTTLSAATKDYVDRHQPDTSGFVAKAGDTMTGSLAVSMENPLIYVNDANPSVVQADMGWAAGGTHRFTARLVADKMQFLRRDAAGTPLNPQWTYGLLDGLMDIPQMWLGYGGTFGNPLRLYGGSSGHCYIGYYADRNNQASRSAYLGFGATDNPNFYVQNETGTGNLVLNAGASGKISCGKGMNFGNVIASAPSNVTNHLALYGSSYGFSVTSGTLNCVSGGALHFISGTSIASMLDTRGLSFEMATAVTGGGNNIAWRWSSPNINGGVDNVNTCVLGTVSDRRLKTAIEPLRTGLREVIRLRPVSFSPLSLKQQTLPDLKRYTGLIADEVKRVLPGAVETTANDPNGMESVNYTALIPVLIKAVQEQQAQIESLEARVAALEGVS